MHRRAYVVAAGMLAVLAVGGCSHSAKSGSAAGDLKVATAGGAGGGNYSSLGGGSAGAARLPAHVPQQATTGTLSADAVSTAKLADTGAKIRIAAMRVAIKGAANVAAKADDADAIAMRAGGDVNSDDRTSGRHASAALQLRVPPEALQSTLHKLSALGHEIGRQLSTTDVTQEVADVHARLVSSNAAIDRLRLLYKNASKVKDVIAVENELTRREADRESMQARERALTHETAMATINLTLVTAAKKAAVAHKPAKKHGGFLGGIQRGWNGFVAAAVWVASAIGTALPFAGLLAVVFVAVRRWGWTRQRPSPAPTPSE